LFQFWIKNVLLVFKKACLRKQDVVAQNTAEVEYIAAITAINQAIWIKKILADLHMDQLEPT
jgi:hypothetical protein